MQRGFEVIVVGGGHAGAEAAWAAANVGVRVALVTLDPARIGLMPCNPAIGGIAKGQMVREIDALGGLMGLAADASGIMFKTLNVSRGPAVRGPRAQCDKHVYAETVRRLLAGREQITIIAGRVERVLTDPPRVSVRPGQSSQRPAVRGVVVTDAETGESRELRAGAVVITTGTFMRGLMHKGAVLTPGGRDGEASADGVAGWLREVGFELGRLKTGTPPRLRRSTIDWDALEAQAGDDPPEPFSDLTGAGLNPAAVDFPALAQTECRITRTTPAIHGLIRKNLDRAPMFNGQVEAAGPRYCPSIEDKVVRFSEREAHHVFLEPESHRDESVYCNGISTSLPEDVQREIVRGLPGCGRAEVLKFGYAVEYDSIRPHQIDASCAAKGVAGLFFAGQINGTSGYEEAAGQGLLAGLNAARHARGGAPRTLGRDQAYIGVMMDDLVVRTPVEPYRMFTSRAEHRLTLRADNAADRLTPIGRRLGLVDDARWRLFEARREARALIESMVDSARVDGEPLAHRLKRPGFGERDLLAALDLPRIQPVGSALWRAFSRWARSPDRACVMRAAARTVLADRQYAGYLDRQRAEIRRQREMERRAIPGWLDYGAVTGLRAEARAALARFRPATYGQASRLEGVTPADVSLVMITARRGPTEGAHARAGA